MGSEVPFLAGALTPNSPYDWNYTTVPQIGLQGRSVPYPRGRMLGGTSSTSKEYGWLTAIIRPHTHASADYLIWTRGSQEDYDKYAEISGDKGWSWGSLQPYFKKIERWSAPVDGHNTTGQFDPAVHSFKGMVSVSLPGYETGIDKRVINASQQLGGEFKFNPDMNSGSELGIGWSCAPLEDFGKGTEIFICL